MWRRTYLALVLLRLYFALSPSYIHPDEHYQGPEIIAGHIFGYQAHLPWEFTVDKPVRSIFPLWMVYGWPLTLLKWIWEGFGLGIVPTTVIFYSLRIVMFMFSFVLEDWALHELLHVPKERRIATILVASSYVTGTYQTHTFSNSAETLLVLWCLVLVQRIKEAEKSSRKVASVLLAFLGVLGTFNRITFPAFLVIPLLQLIPHMIDKPVSLLFMAGSGFVTLLLGIAVDTEWYTKGAANLSNIKDLAVLTPWNNFVYNSDVDNLAKHGLHPFYQHALANLPQLLGPAILLCIFTVRSSMQLYSAICGIALLSCFQHQEARFLIPAVPLFLSSVNLPKRFLKPWIAAWVIFNLALGLLMGVYHQGGLVPAQLWIAKQDNITQAYYWRTYTPPMYLLGARGAAIESTELGGMSGPRMIEKVMEQTKCDSQSSILVAPHSAIFLDDYTGVGNENPPKGGVLFRQIWTHRHHLNLDDMDFGDDGVWPTVQRVFGRRGLGIWQIHREC